MLLNTSLKIIDTIEIPTKRAYLKQKTLDLQKQSVFADKESMLASAMAGAEKQRY